MPDISEAQLRRLDLTLLLVFEEIMARGKLSAAAQRLGLTQSAVSHAVGRLRQIFDDPLFVRMPHGVAPTARARQLRAPLGEALRLISGALRPAEFDPSRDARVFRIGASDHLASVFGPPLAAEAPAPRFAFLSAIRGEASAALLAGELDLALGYLFPKSAGCERELLYTENYMVVGRAGHPALQGGLGIEAYAQAGHVLASPGGSLDGIVDRTLAAQGLTRAVRLAVPYFLAAFAAAARTDLLATVPARLARHYAPGFGLDQAAPPVEIRSFAVNMAWARRTEGDAGGAWLRALVRSVAGAG